LKIVGNVIDFREDVLTQIGVKVRINFHTSTVQRSNFQLIFTHADRGDSPN